MMRGMDMAEVIRRRRAELGLSQADLASSMTRIMADLLVLDNRQY